MNKKEKQLTSIIVVLLLTVIALAYMNWGNQFLARMFNLSTEPSPPTMEDSIETAEVVFSCHYETVDDDTVCRIVEIFFKKSEYNFPYSVGELYKSRGLTLNPSSDHGEGAVVFVSKSRVPWRAVAIHDGLLPAFNRISVDEFREVVQKK